MAKCQYIGVDGVARKVKKKYFGVDGVARQIKKGYVGVDGVARQYYSTGTPFTTPISYSFTTVPLNMHGFNTRTGTVSQTGAYGLKPSSYSGSSIINTNFQGCEVEKNFGSLVISGDFEIALTCLYRASTTSGSNMGHLGITLLDNGTNVLQMKYWDAWGSAFIDREVIGLNGLQIYARKSNVYTASDLYFKRVGSVATFIADGETVGTAEMSTSDITFDTIVLTVSTKLSDAYPPPNNNNIKYLGIKNI